MGDIIFQFTGDILPIGNATPFSLQISENLALESNTKIDDNLNHSCDPNCRIFFEGDIVLLIALKDINPNEELTFNYNTTEYDMTKQDCSFVCHCGSTNCIGEIKGFTHLSPEKKQELAPYLSPFLASHL
jgi:SET domain-containing protein